MDLITAAKEKCVPLFFVHLFIRQSPKYLYLSLCVVYAVMCGWFSDALQGLLYCTFNPRYMAASRRCKFAEDTIETESKNVEQLTKVVEEKFSEVHKCRRTSF